MKKSLMITAANLVFWVLAFAPIASAQTVGQLIPHKVKLEAVNCLGKQAVKITEDGQVPNGEAYAIVKDSAFHNGAVDVELAGRPADGAFGSARGFIGIAFHLQNAQFEYIYLRPTNGRADDQVAAIIPRSIVPSQILVSRTPASRHRKSMRVMWTSNQAFGPATASRSKERKLAVCSRCRPALSDCE